MKPSYKLPLTIGCGAAVALAGMFAARARAAGVPEADALTYTGYLEDGAGVPLTGIYSLAVRFWEAADKGKAVCSAESASVSLVSGRFQLPLPIECTNAVKNNPDLYADVLVDGASLGRTKLGAVPYALEAAHATNADEAAHAAVAAAAAGELEKRLAALETRLGPLSSVRAHLKQTQGIVEGSPIIKVTLTEDADAAGEFDQNTSTFSPSVAGSYFLQCNLRFETNAPGVSGWFDASVLVDGTPVARDGFYGDGWTAFRNASGIFNLKKGQKVTCGANQQASGAATRNIAGGSLIAYRVGPAE